MTFVAECGTLVYALTSSGSLKGATISKRTLTESLRVRLSKEQLEELQRIAERDDRSVGAVARRAINDLLAKNGKESQ